MQPPSRDDSPRAPVPERIPLRYPPGRAALAGGVLVAPLAVAVLLTGGWGLVVGLPVTGLLALALALAHWAGRVGVVVLTARAVEVRRWGLLAERYDFADVVAIALGKGHSGREFVGLKLRQPPSARTQPLPASERKSMIEWPEWDVVLPLETAVSAADLAAKIAARHAEWLRVQGPRGLESEAEPGAAPDRGGR